jgi:hypothetical protein
VTTQVPFTALVTQADPAWNTRKHREVEYAFEKRVMIADPYIRGAYNSWDNEYPVGQQYGTIDPLLAPLAAFNLGTGSVGPGQSVSITLAAAVPAGAVILVGLIDDLGPINYQQLAAGLSDGVNVYEPILGAKNGGLGSPFFVAAAVAESALAAGATLTYTSPAASNLICMVAVCVTGGITPAVFDAAVNNINFATSGQPTVTSGQPQQQNELFVGFSTVGLATTYTQDTADAWTSLQQDSNSNAIGPKTVCSAFQTGPIFDPGSNTKVTFAPGLVANASRWVAAVVGIQGYKPLYQAIPDGKGWA